MLSFLCEDKHAPIGASGDRSSKQKARELALLRLNKGMGGEKKTCVGVHWLDKPIMDTLNYM